MELRWMKLLFFGIILWDQYDTTQMVIDETFTEIRIPESVI